MFLFKKLDPCNREGAVRVALEVPYGSRGGAVRQLQKDRLPCLLPIGQDPEPPSEQTLGDKEILSKNYEEEINFHTVKIVNT